MRPRAAPGSQWTRTLSERVNREPIAGARGSNSEIAQDWSSLLSGFAVHQVPGRRGGSQGSYITAELGDNYTG
jgi:hypothetical protein